MRVSGIKATGLSRGFGTNRRAPPIEMVSGTETVNRRPGGLEYCVSLRCNAGGIRLEMNEAEMRDWYMRLGRALALAEAEHV
jgi:hypothetical protein